ncbi:MAG TPA: TrmH family RNA methyltransferase [Actinomycetota bacterium]|nr:TrmH family RNA methyltransferase [Actinomycetota bacterium]
MLRSVKHPTVADAARLRKRAFRDEARRFLVEGAQAVREALDAGRLDVLFTSDALDPLALRSAQAGVQTHHVSDQVVRRLTSTVTPQALVGVAPYVDAPLQEALSQDDAGCVALLHEVRDPGNAGTVMRSADAAGASAVVFSATSVDVYNPKTVRASAGSVFHLPVVRGVSTVEAMQAARARGLRVLAMAADGATDLYRTDLSGPVMFVFGNEARGLPPEVVTNADDTVRVPQSGRAESLNLGAAATVCMFEWRRRSLRSAEALENIVGAAAHDIRSPLTAMKGFGYALERRWDSMDEEQRAMMLQGIVHDADRMDTILRLLVDAARIVAGNLEVFPERVDVEALVRSVAAGQRRDPDHPAIEWRGGAVTAFVDPARLKTTLLAFCESLVWWGGEGAILVDAEMRDGELRLRASRQVSDLHDGDVEALFLPRRPGEGAGTKIGLFVARGVAEAQGGRCWGGVADGRLSFQLELPAGPDVPASTPPVAT